MRTKKLMSSCVVLVGAIAALLLAGCAKNAPADEKVKAAEEAQRGFSFAVYGDSRSMMYLPYRSDQEKEARQLMVDMFELVLPAKVSQAVVDKHVKLTYDPATKELVQIVMPFDTASEVTTLTLDKGWVTEASVEDVKLLPGVRRTMFRLQGGDWVAREIVKDVQERSGKVCSQHRRHGVVGQAGQQALRQSVLETGERRRLKQLPHAGPGNAGRRAAWARFPCRRQSRSVGGLRRRRPVECFSLSEEVRGFRQTTHLQVRLPRRSLHLPVDRQI